jgi:hypothetical protein
MHITTGITLNPSQDRKEAVGQNMKWNGKLSEPPPAPLREDIQKVGTRSELKEGNEEQVFSPSAPIGLAVALRFVNLFAFHEQSKPCYSARLP